MYLLDSNTFIYFFQGKGNVTNKLASVAPESIGLATVVLFELELGIAKLPGASARRRKLDALSKVLITVPFEANDAVVAAEVRANLEARGTPIGPIDTLIAGIAIANNMTPVTHNTREFSRVKGLKLEDWF